MKSWKLFVGAACLIGIAGVAVFQYSRTRQGASPEPASKAENGTGQLELPEGLSADEYQRAEKWFRERYASQAPTRSEVLFMAGSLATAEKKPETALACYRAIPSEDPARGLAARLEEGLLLVQLNRADEAEAAFRSYIDAARVARELKTDDVITAFKWLDYILSVEIRQEERKEFLGELHMIGLADPFDSKQYFFPNLLILNSPAGRTRIQQFLEKDPQNVKLLVAQGRYKTYEGKFDEAIELLDRLLNQHPGDTRIGAALLEAYFESDNLERFEEVLKGLPPYAAGEPWLLTRMRGEAAMEDKQYNEALRYFQAVLEQDPANAPAQMGLARAYEALGDKKLQAEALRRSGILAEIRVNLSSLQASAASAASELADKCQAIHFDQAAQVFRMHAQAIQAAQQKPGP